MRVIINNERNMKDVDNFDNFLILKFLAEQKDIYTKQDLSMEEYVMCFNEPIGLK